MNKLKPCPFCGAEATLTQQPENGKWQVACNAGDYALRDVPSRELAVEAWNRGKPL